MRNMAAVFLVLLLFSYFDKNKKTEKADQQTQRILKLEAKIDSLISIVTINGALLNNKTGFKDSAYNTLKQFSRCQALTRKGTQCLRKAKKNNYCWQHGG